MATGNDSTFEDAIGMGQRKLDSILSLHRRWLDPHERDGIRADLSGKNLRGLSFREADLQKAIFRCSDLTGADLSHAQLNEANLRGAILKDAILDGATLRKAQVFDADLYGARLKEVDLSNVEGLTECQLAGTDLSNAKLPPGTDKFAPLEQIKDISVQARTLLWVTISACVFGVVTMSMTNDAAILSHIGQTLLPLVQINVPIAVFFYVWPVILLGLYLYLHFQLQYLWNGLASLPSFFPDGVSLDVRAYPLFLRSLVRLHVPLLKPPAQWRLQAYASIAAAWLLVPSTIFLFWIRYLRMHEIVPTVWHAALFALVLWFRGKTYHLAVDTLGGKRSQGQRVAGQIDRRATRIWRILGWITAIALVILFLLVSVAAFCIEGSVTSTFGLKGPSWCEYFGCLRQVLGPRPDNSKCFHKSRWIPGKRRSHKWTHLQDPDKSVFQSWIKRHLCASFSYGDISHKPDNWLNLKEEERGNLLGVKGALLSYVNLQGADGRFAFLADATLDHADLQGADLSGADLRKATLNSAQLQKAELGRTDLRGANLNNSSLQHANLKSARLSPLIIPKTSNSEECCFATSISGAHLECANLFKADLEEANLEETHLEQADLGGAKLRRAILKKAELSGANLYGADLRGADLSTAKNLTNEQIKEACCDGYTKLPSNFQPAPKPCGQCLGHGEVYDNRQPCRPCR